MLNLDLSNVQDASNFIIPEGTYTLQCFEVEVKETKSGGEMIRAKFMVIGGDHHNAKIFHNFNIRSNNPKAVEIGLSQIKSFMKCSGMQTDKLNDVNDLLSKECLAVVKVRKSDEYPDQNVISYFKMKNNNPSKEPKVIEQKFPF